MSIMTDQSSFPTDTTATATPAQTFDVAAASTGGLDGENQDSYFIGALKPAMAVTQASSGVRLQNDVFGSPSALLMIVADGLGGISVGALASGLAVEEAASFTLEHVAHGRLRNAKSADAPQKTIPGLRSQLAEAIQASDDRVRQAGEASANLGTTLTIGYLVWPFLYVAHVGDTRANLIRDNRLVQLTQDHVVAPVGEPCDRGPNFWHRILWNTLGDQESLARPELSKFTLQSHDQWLLCSAGLHSALSERQIVHICQTATTSRQAAEHLVAAAQAAGAQEDVTVACGRCAVPFSTIE